MNKSSLSLIAIEQMAVVYNIYEELFSRSCFRDQFTEVTSTTHVLLSSHYNASLLVFYQFEAWSQACVHISTVDMYFINKEGSLHYHINHLLLRYQAPE